MFSWGLIADFGISMTIVNTIVISCSHCQLNFRTLQDKVKSPHFPERKDARRQYFYFLYKYLAIIGMKQLGQAFWTMIWIYYLLNRVRLNLNLDNF